MADPWAGSANMYGYQNQFMATPQPQPVMLEHQAVESSTTGSAVLRSAPKRQVNSNACEPCRKRKSKCDGERPYCKSCSTLHMTACHYDLDKDLRRKGALRREIQKLRDVKEDFQYIFDTLCLAEESQLSCLMQVIRSNQSIRAIADILRLANFSMMGGLQAAPLPGLGGGQGENALAAQPVLEVTINPPSVQINQPAVQTPDEPEQHNLYVSQSVNTSPLPHNGGESVEQAPPGVLGW